MPLGFGILGMRKPAVGPLTAFRFPFREEAVARRFRRLSRLLDAIQLEISRESLYLRSSEERMTDCAAFACEAMENGECLSRKVVMLTGSLSEKRRRLRSLERQGTFVAEMRSCLEAFLSRHG